MSNTGQVSCTEIHDGELRVFEVQAANSFSHYTPATYHFASKLNTKSYFSLSIQLTYCFYYIYSITSLIQTRNKTTNSHIQTTLPHDLEAKNGY